jgi:glycosyltransferase involved in cell wall biosynthesis
MNKEGLEVLFVLPKAVDAQYAEHVKLISPRQQRGAEAAGSTNGSETPSAFEGGTTYRVNEFEHVTFKSIPTWLTSPYQSPTWLVERAAEQGKTVEQIARELAAQAMGEQGEEAQAAARDQGDYAGDMLSEVQRYANMCVQLTRGEKFDIIHAHDWMTYPAGLAIAALSGKPLVVQVHSTEFDRSGENIDSRIYDIERRGIHGAIRVICVSHLTRNIAVHRYGVAPEKVSVVYNGIEMDSPPEAARITRGERIVLFLGRITLQKGPEYFVAAARKVLQKADNVKFVMAGSGDMVQRVIELAAEMGIGHKILFTGFLRGKDVDRIFKMADVYVMPSVSEPFGIAPLEAIRHDVPVIISKNSGVAEVLTHALKVDFWDIDEMANKIIAVLKHPPLANTLREHADFDVRKLTWETAARECLQVYGEAIAAMAESSRPLAPSRNAPSR